MTEWETECNLWAARNTSQTTFQENSHSFIQDHDLNSSIKYKIIQNIY